MAAYAVHELRVGGGHVAQQKQGASEVGGRRPAGGAEPINHDPPAMRNENIAGVEVEMAETSLTLVELTQSAAVAMDPRSPADPLLVISSPRRVTRSGSPSMEASLMAPCRVTNSMAKPSWSTACGRPVKTGFQGLAIDAVQDNPTSPFQCDGPVGASDWYSHRCDSLDDIRLERRDAAPLRAIELHHSPILAFEGDDLRHTTLSDHTRTLASVTSGLDPSQSVSRVRRCRCWPSRGRSTSPSADPPTMGSSAR